MADQDQPKTKAELLRELQSIQNLLDERDQDAFPALDDEDIPLLDEFIDADAVEDTAPSQPHNDELHADEETLDALNAAYAALTGDLDSEPAGAPDFPKDTPHEKATEPAQGPQHQEQATARANAASHAQQASQAGADAPIDAESEPHEPENFDHHTASPAAGYGAVTGAIDPAAPAPLPGQQSLFELPANASASLAESPALRPAQVTKASGENPFLPQHIRERLRGNQPLPKAEFKQPKTPPAHLDLTDHRRAASATEPAQGEAAAAKNAQDLDSADAEAAPVTLADADVEQLVDDLVAEYLPQLAQRLRQQLLAKLGPEDPTEH